MNAGRSRAGNDASLLSNGIAPPNNQPDDHDSKRTRAQALVAAGLLFIGIVGGGFLVRSALATPLPGSEPEGTELVDFTTVTMPTAMPAVAIDGPSTLVLYEAPNEASEIAAISMINLAGHFGPATARSVFNYNRGDAEAFDAVVFVSLFDEQAIPRSFLNDVASDQYNIMWLGLGVGRLALVDPDFFTDRGWVPSESERQDPTFVTYKTTSFERSDEASPTMLVTLTNPDAVEVLATASEPGGAEFPYALRSGNLMYVAGVPFDYLVEANHSLVVADLMFELLEPERPERHQALVRLEDVGPYGDPESLRRIADELFARNIPFSVAVYTVWRDPRGLYGWGTDIRLADRPDVVETLEYLESKGGTLLMHGVTHQYGELPNPYEGVSGEDFEFFKAHLDSDNNVILDGPVEDDSAEWVRDRIHQGFAEMADAGLDAPSFFEFPHYAGSAIDYQTLTPYFDARYDQGTYYPGLLSGEPINDAFPHTQFVPYPVLDAYGEYVVPENLGNIIPVGFNNHAERFPEDLIAAAERNLVVRDGVASFFFHPFLDIDYLLETVDGMTALGYEFVSPEDILEGWR